MAFELRASAVALPLDSGTLRCAVIEVFRFDRMGDLRSTDMVPVHVSIRLDLTSCDVLLTYRHSPVWSACGEDVLLGVVSGGSAVDDVGFLTVGLELDSPSQEAAVARQLASQPLLPRWRIEAVDDEDAGATADVVVVGSHGLARAAFRDGRQRVMAVLREPGELQAWQGVGSLVMVDDPRGHVARAVEETAQGRIWISERLAPYVARAVGGSGPAPGVPSPREPLTSTESATLTLVLDGLSNMQIADRRGVSLNTVKSCVRSVLNKYLCNGRAQLIALLARRGNTAAQ